MTRAAIALGSNLGDRRANLESALTDLGSLMAIESVSDLYRTAPIGGPEQDHFLNAVVIVETDLGAPALLAALHEIEDRAGRTRDVHWGPRTLDLDLLLYGREAHPNEDLMVPHPRMLERRFVLDPLLEVWPDAELPDGTPIAPFAARVEDQHVERLGPWGASTNRFHERGGWWVVVQFVLIGLVVLVSGMDGPALPGRSIFGVVGVALAAAGLVQASLGILQLGDRLTPFPEPLDGGGIVHGGIYSIVRHPIYGGIVLGLVGIGSLRASVYGLMLSGIAGMFFWLKAGREEARLTRRFPHYADYRAKTRARLVPWVF